VFGYLVGRARVRTGVKAPATTGDPVFERYFRAHQNSLEQMAVTIPALWLFGIYVHELAGALLGVAYLVGRTLYFRSYVADAASRGRGFMIGGLATIALMLGALVGAIMDWIG
jgi:glutathione S-transferase